MLTTKENGSKKSTISKRLTSFGQKKRLYISGPITNHPNYLAEFKAAEERLRSIGFQPINPAKILSMLPDTLSYEQMMYLCYAMIDLSEGIYMLRGWSGSRGAKLELEYAFKHDKPDFYEEYD